MLFLTCQTSLTHSFVPQHVLNTSFIVYRTPHNMTQCILSISFFPFTILFPGCRNVQRMSSRLKTSLNLSFLFATCPNTSSFPCKVPLTCIFFVQDVVRMHFLSTTCLEHVVSCLRNALLHENPRVCLTTCRFFPAKRLWHVVCNQQNTPSMLILTQNCLFTLFLSLQTS